ncbi:MAG: hypothetical protein KIT14_24665 [bacterium]|nr:hypothetical protein [bacterium]
MPRRPLVPTLVTVVVLLASSALAADAVIGAKKLLLSRAKNGRAKLVLVARDVEVPGPRVGGADDPAGTPGGIVVEVFTPGESARLTAPGGAGRPGWKVRGGVFRFANPRAPASPSPLRLVVLKPGRLLKLVARETGLAQTAPLGQVRVRVTVGSIRRCVTFAGASVKRDRPGRFVGTDAPAGAGTCDDAGGATTTTTMAPGVGATTTTTAPGGGATTTSTTSSAPTTTSTTLVPGTPLLDVTIGAGAGVCGELRDASATPIGTIACGGLDIGGGGSSVPEGLIPDGATNRFVVGGCTGSSCTLHPTATPGDGFDCTAAGCRFGPPLPIPNAGLSVCVVNIFAGAGGGTVDTATGTLSLVVPLGTRVHLTGNATQPCPRCSGSGTPESPGAGVCDRGARAGQPCSSANAQGLSADCPPGGGDGSADLGAIAVDLTPLATTTATASDPAGAFCGTQRDAGCFGKPACRAMEVSGLPAGPLALDTPAAANLASTFCIPAVGNIVIDGAASLPGPGAASLSVTVTRRETAGGPTTTTTTTDPGGGASTTTTTTLAGSTTTTSTPSTTSTTTTTLLPALLPLTLEFMSQAPSGSCGSIRNGAGTTLAPLACGDLVLGDGAGLVPAAALPDGAVVHFRIGGCSLLPLLTCALAAEDTAGAQHDCTTTGCFFGPPVPLPNGALSACSVNRFSAPASGTVNLLTGATSANVALALQVFVTGDAAQPCPRCSAAGAPGAPGSGTCDRGARAGLECTSINSQGLSRDCLPGGSDGSVEAGTIAASLSPVTTGTVTRSNPGGSFCAGQATAGCFGNPACRSIVETGSAPGLAITSLLLPAPATLVSAFCVPATGNLVLDGPAGLPGPAAISLQGAVRATL